MILLDNDKLQIQLGTAVNLDVHCSYFDTDAPVTPSSNTTGGRQNTQITTTTLTDITGDPGSVTRTLKLMLARNKSAGSSDVTVFYNMNGTSIELFKCTLRGGETLEYNQELGFFVVQGPSAIPMNFSTADQTANAADTYLTGSALLFPSSRPIGIGTVLRWTVTATKTGAGTATPITNVRFGTAGSTSDTGRLTFTSVAQTAAVDAAEFTIEVLVRGPISLSCIVHGTQDLRHHAGATGFANDENGSLLQVTSSAFDITTANIIAGLSMNPGTAGVWTIQKVIGQVLNN